MKKGQFIVVEGIECQQEFELLQKLGMIHAQGFYLGKPKLEPIRVYPVHLTTQYWHQLRAQ